MINNLSSLLTLEVALENIEIPVINKTNIKQFNGMSETEIPIIKKIDIKQFISAAAFFIATELKDVQSPVLLISSKSNEFEECKRVAPITAIVRLRKNKFHQVCFFWK